MAMHSTSIGCCLLIMVNFSVSQHIIQKPRFLGVKHNRSVPIYCAMPTNESQIEAEWFKGMKYDLEPTEHVVESNRIKISKMDNVGKGLMKISHLQPSDSGVYFCRLDGTWGPGTELQVFRKINAEKAVKRSRIKDTMIFVQALLLVVFIMSLVLHLKKVKKEEDNTYEEPEDNHIYEGLEIEHCGLYEDIPAPCHNSEATWNKAESSCEE